MNIKVLKGIKIAVMIITLACFIGLVYHFIRAISLSLFENDIKTAQNRIRSAYQFLMMLGAGLCTLGGLIGTFSIKVQVLPSCIGKFFGVESIETKEVN